MKTVIAQRVQPTELARLDETVACLGDQSAIAAALSALAASVRAGADVIVGARDESLDLLDAAKLLRMSHAHLTQAVEDGLVGAEHSIEGGRVTLAGLAAMSRQRDIARAQLAERFAHAAADRALLVRKVEGICDSAAAPLGF